MMKKIFLTCFYFWSFLLRAQKYYEPVFPLLDGQDLFESVNKYHAPDSVLSYAFARDTLFLKIDAVNRNLSCVYTGLTLPIPEGSDPTQAVFLNGIANGINTEHMYPLSLGTENTNAQSDMHHLYPSKVKTNADRGNLPFRDSPDDKTKRWYLLEAENTVKPQTNIDKYSELGDGFFEPREEVKGDIARAIFYIYTIYRDEVNAINDQYFNTMQDNICIWHDQDPVDEKEWIRNKKIAAYQGNQNPFILDCTLAYRMYCGNTSIGCKTTSAFNLENKNASLIYKINEQKLIIPFETKYNLSFYTALGVKIYEAKNMIEQEIDLYHLPLLCGLYFVKAECDGQVGTAKIVIP